MLLGTAPRGATAGELARVTDLMVDWARARHPDDRGTGRARPCGAARHRRRQADAAAFDQHHVGLEGLDAGREIGLAVTFLVDLLLARAAFLVDEVHRPGHQALGRDELGGLVADDVDEGVADGD